MLHYIEGEKLDFEEFVLIRNEIFGVKGYYFGEQKKGIFFLYPVLDTNHNTFYYAIFDNEKQLKIFSKLIKISGVGVKTANYIATNFDLEEIKKAIDETDLDFFVKIPGIGPKTAKKILVELKDKLILEQLEEKQQATKIKEKIIKTLVNLGYSRKEVEKLLENYSDFSDISKIVQDIIKQL